MTTEKPKGFWLARDTTGNLFKFHLKPSKNIYGDWYGGSCEYLGMFGKDKYNNLTYNNSPVFIRKEKDDERKIPWQKFVGC